MTVGTYVAPNNPTQTAVEYKANIDAGFGVLAQVGQAYAPHQSSPVAMTVTIDAGRLPVGGVLSNAQQTTGTITAPVSLPRIDRIVIDSTTGVVSVITGTPAGSPTPPAITAGKLPIAQVLLQTTSTVITNSMITDERTFVPVVSIAENVLSVNTTGVGNVGAGPDDLMTYSLPANTLSADGKAVRITTWGFTSNNANAKTLILSFGTSTATFVLTPSIAGQWKATMLAVRTGSTFQDVSTAMHEFQTGVTLAAPKSGSEIVAANQADTSAITIKAVASVVTSNNDIRQEGMLVELLN